MEQTEEMRELLNQMSNLAQRMSELQAAEQFLDYSPGMVTTWVLLTEYESRDLMEERSVMTFRFNPEEQSRSATAGLIHLND